MHKVAIVGILAFCLIFITIIVFHNPTKTNETIVQPEKACWRKKPEKKRPLPIYPEPGRPLQYYTGV